MKKEVYIPYFKDKRVTVMGLGLLGRGIGDSKFLAYEGANLTITDKKTEEVLQMSLNELQDYKNIIYTLGEHKLSDFENKDFILKAAGVPYDSEYIFHAKKNGIPIYMSAALVSQIAMKELPDVTIIGITGTRGKSTTTQLIAHILKENGLRVHLGGNVRGAANLPLLEVIEDTDYIVMELDSWQLQGFGEMKISPHIAVFTSFLDDHMNYYKNDKEAYFNDKANIYRNQNKFDVLIASPQAHEEIWKRDKKKEVFIPDENTFEMNLIGEHNVVVARLAYEVASQCGLDDESIRSAIKSFKAVEGRLEDMGLYKLGSSNLDDIQGKNDFPTEVYKAYSEGEKEIFDEEGRRISRTCRVFNDNNGTTGDATIAALKAINAQFNKKPILIVGGADKGLPLTNLEEEIKKSAKEVIFLSGTGTQRLSLPKENEYEVLEDCVKRAFEIAEDGDIILYSPAFASFSKYFNNEYEKNDAFVKAVKSYS